MTRTQQLTRRSFLRRSAAAGAMAMSARSYGQVAGASNRLRIGMIGNGNIAGEHLTKLLAMLKEENIEITHLSDVYLKRAEDFQGKIKEKSRAPKIEQDYRKLLDQPDIDYVLIATPEHSHAHITLDALDAGKHVYVEKPMTHTIEEGQAVLAKVQSTGLKLQVGVQGMADDSYSSAHQAILDGKLGSVVQAQIDYVRNYEEAGPWRLKQQLPVNKPGNLDWDAWLKPAPFLEWDPRRYYEWRCYRDYSGGIATDLFIHRLTRLLKACGLSYPERVTGMGGIYTWDDGRDLPDSFEMLCEYGPRESVTNGMTLHILGTMANQQKNDHCIRGTKATLYFTKSGWDIKDSGGVVIESHKKTGSEDVSPHHKNHHAAIRNGAPLNCPADLGLHGVVACRMANLSWFERRMMKWDTETNSALPA